MYKLAGPGYVVGCDVAGTVVDGKDQSLIGKRVLYLQEAITDDRSPLVFTVDMKRVLEGMRNMSRSTRL